MDAFCELVEVITGIPEQGYHLFQLRQFQLDNIAVNGHFSEKCRQVCGSVLCHFLMDHLQLLLRNTEPHFDIPCAVGHFNAPDF